VRATVEAALGPHERLGSLSTPEDFGGKALSEIIWTEMLFRTLRHLDNRHGAARPVGARPAGGGGG